MIFNHLKSAACLLLATATTGASAEAWQEVLEGDWQPHFDPTPEQTGCIEACSILGQSLTDQVSPANTTTYEHQKTHFWSQQQAAVSPACFIQPTTAEEVAHILTIAQRTNCKFAVKSGGHAAFNGASSIEGGITINLNLMNTLTLSDDHKIAHIGPGMIWVDVYEALYAHDLAVVGGRVAEIGVGGLVLGGGISFFSGRYGWACDRVSSYQLVTATGEILEVSHESHPDLYWALRGGGNNFGVVTRFDLETFPQRDMWGGAFTAGMEHNHTLLNGIVDFVAKAPEDVDAAAFVAFAYVGAYQTWITSTQLTHAKGEAEAEILKEFLAVPSTGSTLRAASLPELAKEINQSNPNGLRESYWAATFKPSKELTHAVLDIYMEEIKPLEGTSDLAAALIWQPIGTHMTSHFSRNGGSALGVTSDDGPLLILNLAVMWNDDTVDDEMLAAHQRTIDRAVAKGKELGVHHRFIYQNYAAQSQDIFASYGSENHARLKEISKKYDPEQVFQKLQPGYFKL